ncbi:MAG TPA: hypothetical protein VF406_07965 [Thermodesulfobacteriota bacterium]
MVTAIRYIPSPDHRAPLRGAPLARALRVFYDLPRAEVRARLEAALQAGRPGVAASDLIGLDAAGTLREEVLERLFDGSALERAFVGTEEVPARRAG